MHTPFQAPVLPGVAVDRLRACLDGGGIACARLLPLGALAALGQALQASLGRPLVLVTDGPASLEILFRNLETLAGSAGDHLLLFPAREDPAGGTGAGSRDIRGDRMRALQRCAGDERTLLVATCAQALMQPVWSPGALARQSLTLQTGHEMELDDLLEKLDHWGYVFEPEVVEKGQASSRGGIVDLWPLSEDWPVRMEFFGTVVDSLRAFDPADQRSLDPLECLVIPPVGETGETHKSTTLAHHLPPETTWAWCDPESILHHAAVFEESMTEAGQEGTWVPLDALRRSLRRRFQGGELRCGDGFGGRCDHLETGLQPVEGLPALTAGTLQADLAEEARGKLVDGWLHRARQGTELHVFLYSDGVRERFEEVYLADPGDRDRVVVHTGPFSEGFEVPASHLAVLTENDLYGRRKTLRGRYDLHGRRRHRAATGDRLVDWTDMQPGDFVVHLDHGIGRYLGLYEIEFGGDLQEVLTIEYADKAKLHIPVSQAHLLSRYVGVGKKRPDLHVLGGTRWKREKISAQRAVEDLAAMLLDTQATRETLEGHRFEADTHWQHEFEATFPFEETVDQERAVHEVKQDMESHRPMDRLLCGDVGYGKTEVAMRAAFKAVMDGKQVVMLVPTTVLAQQHFTTFSERMAAFPVRLAMMSRFRTRAEQKEVIGQLKSGAVDIVIGTHRLVQPDVAFKDLGLVIIDEEQRFGVKHKEHFKTLRKLVDVLTLSATPIPRTLYLSLTGARDMSTIQTPPRERLPIETVVTRDEDDLVRRAVLREINRGGQVFFLHNRVHSIQSVWRRLRTLVPEARFEYAHGQMPERQLASVMKQFTDGAFDVLVCTTIIESGVDIPNVNTIFIDRADRFGLSDLYQLRGRVGRYRHKAYAYLLLPEHLHGVSDARRRIQAIQQYSSLGAGFRIALQDLEIRGAGNLLGSQQSGHIAAVGFDLYCQFLQRTVKQMKGEAPPPLVDVELKIEFLDLAPSSPIEEGLAALPSGYVEDESHRVAFYRKLAGAQAQEELDTLRDNLRDRYGPLPSPTARLLTAARVRLLAARRGIRKIEVRDDKIILLDRRGEPMKHATRFARTTAASADLKLEEVMQAITAWPEKEGFIPKKGSSHAPK